MKKYFVILAVILTACSGNQKDFDATGTFEATEITVSAEQNGRLLSLNLTEGMTLNALQQVGLIDTVQLALQAKALGATKESIANQRPDLTKQIAATRQQLVKAEMEQQRFASICRKRFAYHCICWSSSSLYP